MKRVFNDTHTELASYDFYKTKIKRGENIPVEIILEILVPFETKAAKTVTKLKKEIKYWEREFIAQHNLCAPTVTDEENDKTLAQKLKQIKIGTY